MAPIQNKWSNCAYMRENTIELVLPSATRVHDPNGISIGSAVFGRPFVKRFALCYWTVVLSCLCVLSVCLSVCGVGVMWPNGWMDQDETWVRLGLGPGHIVLDGDPVPPPPKGHTAQCQFAVHICCGQMAGCIKMPLDREVCLGQATLC